MAKIIKLTPEYRDQCREEFERLLANAKLSNGKLDFSKSFSGIKREATVWFSEPAWYKMQALIREFDSEVAWHGIAYRGDDPEKDEYRITDILVYPQEVTGATVTTDQDKYQMWLMNHEDEVFNNIRMQGHSHVNMGVTPSSVDTALYDRILDQLDDTMFYIFLIYNKRGDKMFKIYDLQKNILFETSDVTVRVEDDFGLDSFVDEAKKLVAKKTYVQQQTGYGSVVHGCFPSGYGQQSSNTTAAKKAEDDKPTLNEVKKEAEKQNQQSGDKKKKGKRVKTKKDTDRRPSWGGYYEDDDYGYGYGYRNYLY